MSLVKNHKTVTKSLTWFGVIFVIIIVGIIRYRILDIPLERDEGEYAYAGQLIIEGLPLYQNLHTLKFPGTHFAYSIFLTLLDHTHQGIHLGLLIINAITILLVFLLSKDLMKSLGAWFAAASFAVLSLSTSVLGIFAHAEHFVILFSTAGLLFLLRALKNKSMWLFFGSGLLLATSSLMKQNGFFFVGVAVIFILLDYLTRQPRQRQQLFWQYALFTAGLLTTYGMLFFYLVSSGSLENFWFDTFVVSGEYVSMKSFLYFWEKFLFQAQPVFASMFLLWSLVGFGAIIILLNEWKDQNTIFILLFFIFSLLSIVPGLFFRPHYFLLVLPAAALLAGVSINMIHDILNRIQFHTIRLSILIFIVTFSLGFSVYQQRAFLFYMTPSQISRSLYGVNAFPDSLRIAEFIKNTTDKNDRVAILGSEPQILFYSQRRSATSHIYVYPLTQKNEIALEMQKEMIDEIEKTQPEFLIIVNNYLSWLPDLDAPKLILTWLNTYKDTYYHLVGLVELHEKKSRYLWPPNIKWPPPPSQNWIALFKRNDETKPVSEVIE